jgi:hypothetical protein
MTALSRSDWPLDCPYKSSRPVHSVVQEMVNAGPGAGAASVANFGALGGQRRE